MFFVEGGGFDIGVGSLSTASKVDRDKEKT